MKCDFCNKDLYNSDGYIYEDGSYLRWFCCLEHLKLYQSKYIIKATYDKGGHIERLDYDE